MSEVLPFMRGKRYEDFRILVRDMQEKYPEVKRGIIILFDDQDEMLIHHVASSSLLAFAGADLLHRSVVLTEDNN